jgi:HNH endonuclease
VLEFFSFKNFRQFERTRHEIRLPYDLLNDLRFRQLPDAGKAHVLCLLLVSARMCNLLPNHPVKLERLIGATEPIDIGLLAEFIDFPTAEQADLEEVTARKQIPESVRAAVIVRDGGHCRRCGSTRNLEVDHIVARSRGGSSEEDNLQALCRRCNRRKWKKITPRL